MKITLGQLREIINEAIGNDVTVSTSDGKRYSGARAAIERALIKFGASKAERDAIMAGTVPVSSAALATLKGQKAVKAEQVPRAPGAPRKFKDPYKARAAAEKQFQDAVKKYAKNWSHFTQESPDMTPEDAAPDAAMGFFYEYPDWKKWAEAMRDPWTNRPLSQMQIRDIVADHVYDAMTKKR